MESLLVGSTTQKGLPNWLCWESLAILQPNLQLTPSSTFLAFSHYSHNVLDNSFALSSPIDRWYF